jgi:hypothetical protein
MSDLSESIEPDITRIAASAAAIAADCARRAGAPETTRGDAQLLAVLGGHVIDLAAGIVGLTRAIAGMWDDPALLEATIREKLTPGQVAELAARLES